MNDEVSMEVTQPPQDLEQHGDSILEGWVVLDEVLLEVSVLVVGHIDNDVVETGLLTLFDFVLNVPV